MTYIKIDLFSILPVPMTNLSYKFIDIKIMEGPLCITHLLLVVFQEFMNCGCVIFLG
jgi:hypothetical protein